ncbi:MAG: hypothetical protein GX774_00860 [Armatimonadetes bacterium]|nr:hypothetical protein [Armatimonadota bacterium]
MSTCRQARAQLGRCLENHPPQAWLSEHLRRCPACAAELARLREEADRLYTAAAPLSLPDAERLWAGIAPRLPRRRSLYRLLLVPCAPAVLALLLWHARTPAPNQQVGHVSHPSPRAAWAPAPPHAPETPVPAAVPGEPRAPRSTTAAAGGAHRTATPRPSRRRQAPAVRSTPRAIARRPAPQSEPRAGRVALTARTTGEQESAVTLAPERHDGAAAPGLAPARVTESQSLPAEPVAAVVVAVLPSTSAHPATPGSGFSGSAGYPPPEPASIYPAVPGSSFLRAEMEDPVSGTTSHLTVTCETDESGRTRAVMIDYQVRPAAAREAAGET